MLAILIAHALAALAAPACIRAFGRNGFLPLALVPAVSLGWVIAHWGRTEDRADRVGPGPVDESRPALRRPRRDHVLAGAGRRHPRAGLLRSLLHLRRAPPRRVRGGDGGLRRRHVRPGDRRQHAAALRLLGSDDRAVVPAGGAQLRTRDEPARRPAGAARHHRRRAGDAGRDHHPRRGLRELSALRRDRGRAARVADRRLDRADPDRCAEQVGDRADALLAAGCDGGTDPGQRLPARRRDGEGRRLPRRAAGARVRRDAGVAPDRADARRRLDAGRRVARVAGATTSNCCSRSAPSANSGSSSCWSAPAATTPRSRA